MKYLTNQPFSILFKCSKNRGKLFFSVVLFFLVFIHSVTAQKDPQKEDLRKKEGTEPIIEAEAFDKMIIQDITFAVTGERVPTTGVKVDLTKASGTLTGVVYNRKDSWIPFVSVDLGIGATEGFAAIFDSDKELHSDFKISASIIITPQLSSGWMNKSTANLIRTSRLNYKENMGTLRSDSLLGVMLVVIGHKLAVIDDTGVSVKFDLETFLKARKYRKNELIKKILAEATKIDSLLQRGDNPLNSPQEKIFIDLVKRYFSWGITTSDVVSAYKGLQSARAQTNLIILDLTKALDKMLSLESDYTDYQVNLASDSWNIKNASWVSISPFVRRQGFAWYDQSLLQKKDTSSFTFGVGGRYNYLRDWKKGLVYFKIGADLFRANNLSDLKKVEFVQEDSLAGNGSTFIYKGTKGIAYTDGSFDHKIALMLSIEAYIFPFKQSFVPGLYGKFEYTVSKVLKQQKLPVAEFGFPINLNSPDKKKSIVSVVPYFRWDNLNPVDDPEVENEVDSDEFVFGLKIGLPIHIQGM